MAAHPAEGTPEARSLNKAAQQEQILDTSGSGRGKAPSLSLHSRAGWERQARTSGFRREIFRNRRFLNGALHLGLPTKPSEAGLLGKGEARERAQFSPLGGNGAERTLRRRAAVDKVGRRRGGEISPSPPQRTDPPPAGENPLLTICPPGDIVPLSNRHGRRRTRKAPCRERPRR